MPNEVLSFATFVKLLRSYKTRTEQEISDVLDSDASLNPVLDWKQVLMTASLQKNATIFWPLFSHLKPGITASGSQTKWKR